MFHFLNVFKCFIFSFLNSLMGESLNVSLPLQFCGCKARQRSPNLHNLYNWRGLKYVSPYFPYFPKYLSSSTEHHTHVGVRIKVDLPDFPNP